MISLISKWRLWRKFQNDHTILNRNSLTRTKFWNDNPYLLENIVIGYNYKMPVISLIRFLVQFPKFCSMDYFLFELWSSIFPFEWSYNSIGSWNNQPLDKFSSTNRPKLSINEQCWLGSDRLLVWLARWMYWIWTCCNSTTTNNTPTSQGY